MIVVGKIWLMKGLMMIGDSGNAVKVKRNKRIVLLEPARERSRHTTAFFEFLLKKSYSD